ncbi:hypothetical protein SpCBS45565_g04966 [Spizellomyces sp. 'palustris']|nr:hypothetical protein SpCBS45565_g04966 [Spizellomyces sp. 'palustris']
MPLIVSNPPRVVVTGASGLLGRAVVNAFKEGGYDVVGTAYSRATEDLRKLDLTDFAAVKAFVAEQKPQIIIHCAAERRPDVAQNNREGVQQLNIAATDNLAQAAKDNNAWLVYISTDYVFDGTNPPYEPQDQVNPLNFYGQTKYAGEEAVQRVNPGAAILRVPILYGDVEYNGESAVNVLLDVIKKSDAPVSMDDYQVRYPTNVADVAKILKQMADKVALDKQQLSGIYHFSSKEKMSKYSICETIAKLSNLPYSHLTPLRDAPKEPVASRPHDAHLATTRLEQIGIDVSCVPFEQWWKEYSAKKA